MNRLPPPAVLDQRLSQPVKQFRVAGPFSMRPEIVGGSDQARPEMMQPESVDEDSRCQWVSGIRNPACKLCAWPRCVCRQFRLGLRDEHA